MHRSRSRIATLLVVSLVLVVTAIVASPSGASAPTATGKVAGSVLRATAAGRASSFLVVLDDQRDVSEAAGLGTKAAKGRYVFAALRAHADRTQAPLRAFLDRRGAAYRSHFLVNALAVTGTRDLVDALAARDDVARIEPNHWVRSAHLPQRAARPAHAPRTPDGIEWGVKKVRAPQVWMTGNGGQGIVLGNIDTGQQWDHQALRPHYRGWNGGSADHNHNWYDTIDGGPPEDPNGHGTHTAGTMVGAEGTNYIGVAPGAEWIGCRSMNASGLGNPSTYITCLEFMLAPFDLQGQNPNPDLAPVAVSNSWYCAVPEECPGQGTLHGAVRNLRLAGIVPVFSAGNNGPFCDTVGDFGPPAQYPESYSVGATNVADRLAFFSSRGPAQTPAGDIVKPDIVAPGENVRSAYPPNTYAVLSGTSMASPHIAGVIALIHHAKPHLIGDVDGTLALINGTAWHRNSSDCGSDGGYPNHLYGYGLANAQRAVAAP